MKHFSFSALLAIFVAAGASTGCATAIGLAVGVGIDRQKDKVVKPVGGAQEVHTLRAGTVVELRLRDGRALRGRYRGLDWTLTEARISRYKIAGGALAHDLALPALGRGARLALTRGAVAAGELIGYGPDFIIFREEEEKPPVRVSLDRIVSLADFEGRTVTGPRLAELLSTAQPPVVAGVQLERGNRTTIVPYEDVVAVGRLVTPAKAKEVGLLVGSIVDAIAIATLWWQTSQ